MNTKFCKRTLTGIIALGMVISASSCSSSNSGTNKDKNGKTSAVQVDSKTLNSFRAEELPTDVTFDFIDSAQKLGDSGNILISAYKEDNSVLYIANSDFSSINQLKIDGVPETGESADEEPAEAPDAAESGETSDTKEDAEKKEDSGKKKGNNVYVNYLSGVSSKGTIFVVASITDYGDFEMPDWSDPNFDFEHFDYEAMQKAATYKNSIYTLDSDGKLISSCEITGLDKFSSEGAANIDQIIPIDDEKAIISIYGDESSYATIDKDGKIGSAIDFGEDTYINSSCLDKDGNLAFITWLDGGPVLKTFDFKSMKIKDGATEFKGTDLNNINAMSTGDGDYDFYFSVQTGVFGMKSDGSCEEVVNWIDSDFDGNYVNCMIPVSKDEFIVYNQDWNTGAGEFYRLTRRDAAELENAEVLTLGMLYLNSDVSSMVTDFNKAHDDKRIKIIDYSKYEQYDEQSQTMTNSAEDQLKLDIVSGNAPDMIFVYNTSMIKSIASKGVFADLYELLGKDGTPGKDDFLPNVLKACESDGKLVTITPSFSVSTLAAKNKYLNGKKTWTINEFIDTFNSLPKGMKMYSESNSRESILDMLLASTSDVIDSEHGKCSFNTPEFINILKFCNNFTNDEEFDWNNASQAEAQKYYSEAQLAYRKDKAFVCDVDLSDPAIYAELNQGRFGEDVTLIGFPTNDGNGGMLRCYTCFSIMKDAADKDACWQFISQFLSEEEQSDSQKTMGTLPITKKAFEKKMDEATKKPTYEDENGKLVEYDRTFYIGDDSIVIKPLTEDEKNLVKDYILNTTFTGTGYIGDEISGIIEEETAAFFKGERTAEETAELLQNRVSIILSEQS